MTATQQGGMRTVTYLSGVPRPMALAPGEVIVHNHVRPARVLATRGFGAWIAAPDDDDHDGIDPGGYRVVRCDCGWAPQLGDHYRVDRAYREAS
jgi:hypothetical protein